ncbi:hypothetical protein [Intrasporangium sp. YIM S08009]|uniref:hypothetical protein n=1 Tax=Intrasporangium zincisolvens TaxID=3080018 RepID=UPI002B05E79B|nr:hypothetical protein [Intrasporangium sp. YIM S08009]
MKTQTPAPARPQPTSGARLRRLAVVGLAAPVLALTALSACSSEAPVTADPTASAAAGTTPPATSSTSSDTTSSATTTTPAAPATFSTKDIKAVIKDPDLGHSITALRISRNLPFPSNQPVGAEAFEIVGVKVDLTAGSRYSATLDPAMISLVAASPKQTIAPTNEFGKAYKATPLTPAKRGQSERGWLFFKVDRGTSTYLRLQYARPAYEVSTTDKKIQPHTFWVQLTR